MYRVLGADQKEYGPVSADLIRQWIAERRLNASSLVQLEGTDGWKPLAEVPEFNEILAAATPPPVGMPYGAGTIEGGRRLNGLAVTGLILGIFAISAGMCCCYGMPFNLLGAVCSSIALNQIHRDPQRQSGRELAILGLILSLLSLVLGLLVTFFGFTMNYHEIMRTMGQR